MLQSMMSPVPAAEVIGPTRGKDWAMLPKWEFAIATPQMGDACPY